MYQLLLNKSNTKSAQLMIGVVLAIIINFSLFMLMEHMTNRDIVNKKIAEDVQLVDFVRVKRDETQPEAKKRELPQKPKPPEEQPKPPEQLTQQVSKPTQSTPSMNMPKIDVPLNISGGPYLGDMAKAVPSPAAPAVVSASPGIITDNEVMPIVRVPPKYPRSAARRGVEGVVIVSFIITKDGSVRDPKVEHAEPANLFNSAAIKAVLKWKFEPKTVNGQVVERRAKQKIEFNLAQ